MPVEVPYGRFERTLYRLAFANVDLQVAFDGLERRLFRDALGPVPPARPVFVAALPRAGTTLLLDVLAELPEFASPTYRHMPFVLCPLLWPALSRRFHKRARQAERAHGDGIEIGFDSPEAFEDVVWMAFWQDHYRADRIAPWRRSDRNVAFETYLGGYMAKVVAAKGPSASRYLSKNNANVARLALLHDIFADGTVVVPVRQPWAQAASLERQHRHFLRLHQEDGFARDYMSWLGHFEFGAAHRPIDVAGWLDRTAARPDAAAYWLEYWAATYEAVLAAPADRLVLIDYDRLCAEPAAHLEALARALGTADPALLVAQADRFRAARPSPIPDVDPVLVERVGGVYRDLQVRCLAPSLHQSAAPTRLRRS
jgi:hypothetical protein